MSNKETLQGYNNRLNNNNTSLNGILDIINELPEASGEVNLQDKEVTPTKETQVINYDEEYDGLNQVTVKPIPSEYIIPNLQNKSIEITENGTTNIVADEGYDGLNNVEVTTNVGGSSEIIKIAPTSISFSNYTGTEIDLSALSVENLTTLNGMFSNVTNLIKINLGGLDISKMTNIGYMFRGCSNLIEIQGINNLNLSSVTQMTGIFQNCTNLTKLDLNNWNMPKLTYSYQFFHSCSKLIELKVSNWNTSKFTDMRGMFTNCEVLPELDLSGWDTSNVTNMSTMFYNCKALKKLDIRNFVIDKVTSSANMFYGVSSDCLIIVKGDTEKSWVLGARSDLTNVKTVAELG